MHIKDIWRRKKIQSTANKQSVKPARTLNGNSTIEHKEPCEVLDEQYAKIVESVRDAGMHNPIVFIENDHTGPFENNMQRLRYFENMNLTVPIDVRFCPGGGGGRGISLYNLRLGSNGGETVMRRQC